MGDRGSDTLLNLTHLCQDLILVAIPQIFGSNAEKVHCDLVEYTDVLPASMTSACLKPAGPC